VVYCRPSASGKSFLVGLELIEAPKDAAWLSQSAAPAANAARP
jgi:hypothetical protein